MGQETIKRIKQVVKTMDKAGESIKPCKALEAMMDGNEKVRAQYEQLDNDARMVVNIWAKSSPDEQKRFLEFVKEERSKRA